MATKDNKTTPCEIPENDGKHTCPYAEWYEGSDMCRVYCGLGVDE